MYVFAAAAGCRCLAPLPKSVFLLKGVLFAHRSHSRVGAAQVLFLRKEVSDCNLDSTLTLDTPLNDDLNDDNWMFVQNGGQDGWMGLKTKHNKNSYCMDTTKALNALYPYIRGVTNGFIFTCEYDQIYANDNREGCITFTNDLDKALVDVDSEYRCDDSRGVR